MEEEEPTTGFQLTVSPALVRVIAGGGGGSAPIVAKSPRDQAIIDAVTREERTKTAQLVDSLRSQRRDRLAVVEVEEAKRLDARLNTLHATLPPANNDVEAEPAILRCAMERAACGKCYQTSMGNSRLCAVEADAFARCVRKPGGRE